MTPTLPSLLQTLTKDRLIHIGRDYQVGLSPRVTKPEQIDTLERSGQLHFEDLLTHLGRDELKAACRAHDLDDSDRSRLALTDRLLAAHGSEIAEPSLAADTSPWSTGELRHTPQAGDVVHARQRQYLVERVALPAADSPGNGSRPLTRVDLVCLDDDNQGRPLSLLWELELGARVIQPEKQGLGDVAALDAPRLFSAYLHALRWNGVTATDTRLFQSPFRAGIKIINHQLTPLMKALQLPRANLFIADDVGLGKTIEAGLVLQELILRQRVDLVLITCPAAICLQWRDEMSKRFGLRFEIMNRAFIARRRQERGFQVNPWTTHNRFILSHSLLRRPEYRDPLLQRLDDLRQGGLRARKSLLILDEAHVAAPASATKYAVDSQVTRTVRDLAPRFENRLFLSATPHNGHSNSFSSLLEILDPQRFTRGVPIRGAGDLEPVMVRRLKTDLKELGYEKFPERKIVSIDLEYRERGEHIGVSADDSSGAGWWQTIDCETTQLQPSHTAQPPPPVELLLSEKLAEYTRLMKPSRGRKKRLVFINLQKRLLSSLEAFYRTLRRHACGIEPELAAELGSTEQQGTKRASAGQLQLEESEATDEHGRDDEATDADADREIEATSRSLSSPQGRALELLREMLQLAERYRTYPDAKAAALLDWIRRQQCSGVGAASSAARATDIAFPEDAPLTPAERSWTDRRVIVFTEYGDTKRALSQLLSAAIAGTDRADERILLFHGGMSDDQREEVQQAFNAPPSDHPVRILIATDAAREGINLQSYCADLFHFDIPWNPARLEQRNGRIDRTLQPADEVRCHLFRYVQRKEDLVLDKVAAKVEIIRRELGSLSTVLLDRMERALGDGIVDDTARVLDGASDIIEREQEARQELDAQRERQRLKREIERAGEILDSSKKLIAFDPEALHSVVDVGLELAGCAPLQPFELSTSSTFGSPSQLAPVTAYRLPEMPAGWQTALDSLRPARTRKEASWEWQEQPPLPVVFESLDRLDSRVQQLHLEHPFTQRLLSRFLAQGTSVHDLSRVTVLPDDERANPRVVALGRVSLFGAGAARLHDQLVLVSAPWRQSGDAPHLEPHERRAQDETEKALWRLLARAETMSPPAPTIGQILVANAPGDFASLWPAIEAEADHLAHEAERKLRQRGATEAEQLSAILAQQRSAIEKEIGARQQMLVEWTEAEREQREQFERDRRHMEHRLESIEHEIEREPREIEELYRVALRRLEPVGLVYLWPESWG